MWSFFSPLRGQITQGKFWIVSEKKKISEFSYSLIVNYIQ